MFVDKAGTTAAILDDNDMYPWGGIVPGVGKTTSTNTVKFTGQYRDTDTSANLDYFGARYYSNTIGRFMSPDWAAKPTTVPYAKFGDPQSLNLYSYTENGPINRVDTDGHNFAGFDGFMRPTGSGDDLPIDNTMDVQDEMAAAMWPGIYNPPAQQKKKQKQSQQKQNQQKQSQQKQRPLVLYGTNSGQPTHYGIWFWEMSWALGFCEGDRCNPDPAGANKTITLMEQIDGNGPWKSGSPNPQKGGRFDDLISPEARTITQQFSVDGKRIQLVLGFDNAGNFIKTWDVHIVVHGEWDPRPPTYSPVP